MHVKWVCVWVNQSARRSKPWNALMLVLLISNTDSSVSYQENEPLEFTKKKEFITYL